MKILVATEKPFAPVAVEGIRRVAEEAGFTLELLEKYTDRAQLLTAAALTTLNYEIVISPVEIVPYMWYCWILAIFGLLSIFVPYADGICRKDPWNWEYDVAESGAAEKKALLEGRE